MSVGKVLLATAGVFLIGCLTIGGCAYSGYNRAISLDEQVKSAWAQVDNQLQRRFDLLPNLVSTVKGYAAHEEDVFLGVAKTRESYFQAKKTGDVGEQAKAANGFESALSRLLVLQEKYPDLKANEGFLKLQDSLEGTENRLAVERQRYNEQVKTLNTFTRQLLGKIYAGLAGVKPAEYFNVPEAAKANPKLDFSKKP
ncbi:MAG: LemA family protein [Planctomycetes bacterium]|nr:LemA family protein [Planctomycetota bacterium]MBI3835061.1 LemA family protein [Planctomycetota bacterium]